MKPYPTPKQYIAKKYGKLIATFQKNKKMKVMYKQYLVQTIDYIKANPNMWDQWSTPSMRLEGEPTCFGGILLRIMNIEDPYFCSLPESLYAYLSNSCAFGVRRTLPELEQIVEDYQD